MNVTLIYPNIGNIPSYSFGLGVIAAYLKENGHEVQGLAINAKSEQEIDYKDIEKQIKEFNPKLIAFSSVENQFVYAKSIANHLRSSGVTAKFLLGGVYATISQEELIKEEPMDMIVIGEGEDAILELCNKMDKDEDYTKINNVWIRQNGHIIKNELTPFVENLGKLPQADRTLFGFKKIVGDKRGWVNILAGRGCPYKCTYCINHFYTKLNKGVSSIRHRPIEHIFKEIESLEKDTEIKMINFNDDLFTLKKKWMIEFCTEYKKRFNYPFACNARPTNFDQERADALRDAGCQEIKIGIESGSLRLRSEWLERGDMTNEEIENSFRYAKNAGIRTWSFNMIGTPSETREDFLETVKLNAKIRPYILRCSIVFPYKGTDIYEKSVKEGYMEEGDDKKYASYFDGTILKLKDISEIDIFKFKAMFKWYVDAYSDIEVAGFYKQLVDSFENLPDELWKNKKAQELVKKVDNEVDEFFQKLNKEHYSSRSHLDLNFSAETDWELP